MAYTGVDMAVAFKKQSALGTIATGASGTSLRRVSSVLNLKKDTYQSNEIQTNFQLSDFRHGFKKNEGTISGEISPGAWTAFMGSQLRKDFASVSAATGLSLTIAGSGPTYTVTRGSGSWLSDGFKIGHVIRLTVGSLNAANISKNLLITGIGSATVITVLPVNGVAMVAEGPIASCTATVSGKVSYCPTSSQTNDWYTIEHWMSAATISEQYWDSKICDMKLALPPTGIATVEFGIQGLNLTTASSQSLTSPTAATTNAVTAAVNGVLRSSAGALANITGFSIDSTNNCQIAGPVVGSNVGVDIVYGRQIITGQLTAFFDSVTLRDYFINETEVGAYIVLPSSSSAASEFVAISIDRLKFGGADRDDSEGIKTVTLPFQALFNTSGGSGINTEATTMRIQDSAAP